MICRVASQSESVSIGRNRHRPVEQAEKRASHFFFPEERKGRRKEKGGGKKREEERKGRRDEGGGMREEVRSRRSDVRRKNNHLLTYHLPATTYQPRVSAGDSLRACSGVLWRR
jgi:hypothetical protein